MPTIAKPPKNVAGYNPLRDAANFVWDGDAAARAVDFFDQILTHPDDSATTTAGEPFKLMKWQVDYVATLHGWKRKDGLRRYKESMLGVPRKNGKGLALDTPIPTPSGWTTMGEVAVGDTLFDDNGLPCTVTAIGEHRLLDCYVVRFSNDESIVCDGDHLWLTKARISRPGGGHDNSTCSQIQVRDVRQIRDTITAGARGDRNHCLEIPCPLQCEPVALPIDPYVLGAWLGDGHTKAARITCSRDDIEIVGQLQAAGLEVAEVSRSSGKASTYSIKVNRSESCARNHNRMANASKSNGRCLACEREADTAKRQGREASPRTNVTFQETLKRVGVFGNKHIPPEYLRGSYSQRVSLLQGLMDTDGTIDKGGRVLSFDTTSENLRRDVAELLASLGIKFTVTKRTMRCNRRDVAGYSYRLQFMACRDAMPVFRLSRKLTRMRYSNGKRARSRTVQIIGVDPVESVVTKCIQVDSPSKQFLCGKTMLPTHNSTLLSGLALYSLAAEGKLAAQIYSAAMDRSQAALIYNMASRMVRQNKYLARMLNPIDSTKRITFREQGSFYAALSGDASPAHGTKPYMVLFDELHTQRDRKLYDNLRTGQGASPNSLFLSISTAGWNRESLCYEVWKYARAVRDGQTKDPHFLPCLYEINDGEDWTDEKVWYRTNPNLGITIPIEYLREEFERAQSSPGYENTFKNLYLNMWTEQAVRWLSMRHWDKCGEIPLPDLAGRPCWGGLDMSATTDITAFSLVFPLDDGQFAVLLHFWIPGDTAERKERVDAVPYKQWEREGLISFTPGNRIDHFCVRDDIARLCEPYNVQEITVDRALAAMVTRLLQDTGYNVTEFPQTITHLSLPSKLLETKVLGGELLHGGNPVLRNHASNVAIEQDKNENIRPVKSKSTGRIDGIVATIMALGRAAVNTEQSWYYEKNPLEIG